MSSLYPILLVGLLVYFLFSRKGGVGCGGGHVHRAPSEHGDGRRENPPDNLSSKAIDLHRDEYTIRK